MQLKKSMCLQNRDLCEQAGPGEHINIKFFLLVWLFALIALNSGAQQIRYETSFERAKELAKREGKPIAIMLTIQLPVNSPDYYNGLNDKSVADKFNSSFINFRADRSDTAASARIIRQYKVIRFPSFIFLDKKGGLLFTDFTLLSQPKPIIEMADKAIKASGEESLVDYDSIYKSGKYNASFIKEYITKREIAGLTDNSELIEKYVSDLKVSDLYKYDEVLFILKAGPIIDGTAYRLSHLNNSVVDSIFRNESPDDRIAINNTMISNTMNEAIRTKSFQKAVAAANYARSSWGTSYAEGQKNYFLRILQYYLGVKDTMKYLQQASMVYDTYYMNVSIDSLIKKDSLNLETAKRNALEAAIKNSNNPTNLSFKVRVPNSRDAYLNDLNNAAWNFYLMAGDDSYYLFKAIVWSRRTIEISPKPAFYDTYAHLLYSLKFYDEAESMQKKAIDAGRAEKTDTGPFEEAYAKMRKRSL
jgi:hypothetical protein